MDNIADIVEHEGQLWTWRAQEKGSWTFLSLDGETREALRALAIMRKLEHGTQRGFGSLKVQARIGDSEWSTSIFPDKTRGWLLPIKAAIRKAEGIGDGDIVRARLTIL